MQAPWADDDDNSGLLPELGETDVDSAADPTGGAATSPITGTTNPTVKPVSALRDGPTWRGQCSWNTIKASGRLHMLAVLALGFVLGVGVGGLAWGGSSDGGGAAPRPQAAGSACLTVPEPQCGQREPRRGDAHGLVFIGLSLTRNHLNQAPLVGTSNPGSISRQTQFDLNLLTDRDWQFACETNDDGWLVGGGEGEDSPPWMMPNPDSAHVEVVHIGNGEPSKGGLSEAEIRRIMDTVDFGPIRVRALSGRVPRARSVPSLTVHMWGRRALLCASS